MSMSKRLLGLVGITLLCWSQQAMAFECPRMEKTGPGVLQETKQDEQVLSRMFLSGNVENAIGVAVSLTASQAAMPSRVLAAWASG